MKKLILSLAVLSPLCFASPSDAFPTNRTLRITVEGSSVGRITARQRVTDEDDTCRYTLQWTITSPPLGRTVRCDILERKASNDFDCDSNRRRFVTSLIEDVRGCKGFDEFGQQTRINDLTGGESRNGVDGVFEAASVGDVQSFTIR